MQKNHINNDQGPDLVPVAWLAKRYFVSPKTISRWRQRQGFPAAVKLGERLVRFDAQAVDAWVAANCRRPAK